MIEPKRRYPGTPPFENRDVDVFFGRETEIEELFNRVLNNQVSILHGKSGLGKSSILNAGLIQKIEDDGQIIPINIRLGSFNHESALVDFNTPLETLLQHIQDEKPRWIEESNALTNDNSGWYEIRHRFKRSDGTKLLLIFDQFEELFSFPDSDIKAFGESLSEVLYTTIPQRFRDELIGLLKENEEETQAYYNELHAPIEVSILLAIRSDKMSLLNGLNPYIKSILSNCFELKSLTIPGAYSAIFKPALVDDPDLTPDFNISTDLVNGLIDFITNNRKDPPDLTALQIICQYIEEEVVTHKYTSISLDQVESFKTISENYFQKQLTKLGDQQKIDTAIDLLTNGMVLADEKRRLNIYEGRLKKEYPKVDDQLIEQLIKLRIIRVEESRRGGRTFEVSHDTLVEPILRLKESIELIQEEQARRAKELEQEEALKKQAKELKREKQINREIQQLHRRAKNRLYLSTLFGLLMLVGAATTLLFLKKSKDAARQIDLERASAVNSKLNNLLGFAQLNMNTNPTLSFLLAKEALNLKSASVNIDTLKAKQTIRETYNSSSTIQFYNLIDTINKEDITFYTLSKDANLIAASTLGGNIQVYELPSTGRPLFTIEGERVYQTLAVDAKNNFLVAGDKTGLLSLFDLKQNGKKKWDIRIGNLPINAIDFSQNNQFIIVASDDKISVCSPDSPKTVFENTTAHVGEIKYLKVSKDNLFVTAALDKTSWVWKLNPENGTFSNSQKYSVLEPKGENYLPPTICQNEQGDTYLFAPSSNTESFTAQIWPRWREKKVLPPTGKQITAASFLASNQIAIYGTAGNQLILKGRNFQKTLSAHQADITDIVTSPDERYFVSASLDRTVRLWSKSGELLQTLGDHNNLHTQIQFSADGKYLFTVSENELRSWKFIKNETTIISPPIKETPALIARYIEANDPMLLTAYENGSVVLSSPDGKISSSTTTTTPVVNVDYHARSAGKDPYALIAGGNYASIYKVRDQRLSPSPQITIPGGINEREQLGSAAFSLDGNYLIIADKDGNLKVASAENKNEYKVYLEECEFKKKPITKVKQYYRDDNTLALYAFITPLNEVLFLQTPRAPIGKIYSDSILNNLIWSRVDGHEGIIEDFEFSGDQQFMLTVGADRKINTYQFSKKGKGPQLVRTLNGHYDKINYANFSPDNQYIVSCSADGMINIWDNRTDQAGEGICLLSLQHAGIGINMANLSADNKKLIYCDDNGYTYVKPIELSVDQIMSNVYREKIYGNIRELSESEKQEFGLD